MPSPFEGVHPVAGNAMTTYFLKRHVFACIENNYIVFLDVRKDAYSCIDHRELGTSFITIAGLPSAIEPSVRTNSTRQEAGDALNMLLKNEILTASEIEGKPFDSLAIPRVERSLFDVTAVAGPKLNVRQARHFFTSALSATVQLKASSFGSVIDRVSARKRCRIFDSPPPSPGLYEGRIGAFRRLRSIFPREYLCLFDSFALIEFLACESLFPSWVFGIQLSPFSAHCWVQSGDTVLNGSLESVVHFTPIMAV